MAQDERKQLTYTKNTRHLRPLKGITLPGLCLLLLFTATGAVSAAVIYVNLDNTAPSAPYSTWADAANNMGDATKTASIGDTIIVRASSATPPDNEYAGFAIPEGTTVQAEFVGVEYPIVSSGVTFAKGDYTTNPAVIEGFDIYDNGGKAIVIGDTDIKNTTIIRYNKLHGNGKPAVKHTDGTPTIEYNDIYGSSRTGISIQGATGSTSEAMIVRGNNIHNNGTAGTGDYKGNVYFRSVRGVTYILFQNNHIYSSTARGGVNITAGQDYLYFTGNEFYDNPYAGIHVSGNNTGKVIISGEPNFTFPASGPSYTNGSPNLFHHNGRGGISIADDIYMDIISNDFYDNQWGGISTDQIDPDTTYPNYVGYSGTMDGTVLNIRKNYIHGNGKASNTIGGGINARAATATIKNNVIYKNNRAGIRVGDFVQEISNNTVVANGNNAHDMGGGITYDNQINNCMDCMPSGTKSSAIPVKNNVIAYNEKAALMGLGFTNTPGSEERDYNLIYSNNPGAFWWVADCDYPIYAGDPSLIDFKCPRGQYGFGAIGMNTSNWTKYLMDPNDWMEDPQFKSMTDGSEDYQLDTGSPGINAGSDNTDMGAWGGTGTFFDIPTGCTPGTDCYGTYEVPMNWSHLPHPPYP